MKIDFGVNDQGEQYYKIPLDTKNRKRTVEIKNEVISNLKDRGLFLTFLGVKINGVGSNNPLLLGRNCVTPTYKFLYKMNQLNFKGDGEDFSSLIGDELLKLEMEFDSNALTLGLFREKLKQEGILVDSILKDSEVLLQSLNNSITIDIIFKIVKSNYDINEYIQTEDLQDYYLPINSKSITHRTIFNKDNFYFKVIPRIENFTEIMSTDFDFKTD